MTLIEQFKEQVPTVADAWSRIGLPNPPPSKDKYICKSPFRDDNHPSFSIYNNGERWKDFATGEGGDVVDFLKKATGIFNIMELWRQVIGGEPERDAIHLVRPIRPRVSISPIEEAPANISAWLRESRHNAPNDECLNWAEARGIALDTLRKSKERGEMRFFPDKWTFVMPCGAIKTRKLESSSRSCRWMSPPSDCSVWGGDMLDMNWTRVIVTEGESDRLRTLQACDGVGDHTWVVSAQSASHRPTKELAYRIGAFREVVLAFDNDEAGAGATGNWIAALSDIPKCRVRVAEIEADDICKIADDREINAIIYTAISID